VAKKKRRRRQGSGNSRLADHKRTGTIVQAPLKGVPNLQLAPWVTDSFPDFLWMCSLLVTDSKGGLRLICDTLDTIDEVSGEVGEETATYGRLTQFEAIPSKTREVAKERLQAGGLYEHAFPEEYAHALGMYPSAPGGWLLDPWRSRGLSVDPQIAQQYLAPVIAECFHGQREVPTRAKFLYLRGLAKAGRLHLPVGSDLPDLLSRYPGGMKDDEETAMTESMIRAAFSALSAVDEADSRIEWGKTFWRSNWNLYACIRADSGMVTETTDSGATLEEVLEHFVVEVEGLRRDFHEIALKVDPDLYAPDRYEVLTGITARALRLVEGAVGSPRLWTDEFGATVLRSLVEAKILIHWLHLKDDASLYTRFKDFGRGRLKLLMLHTREHIETLGDVPAHLADYLAHLEREVNADTWEEFQDIDIGGSFAGKSARDMAIEVNLKSDYDFVFAPTSGTAHGDWTSLDRYSLSRCLNPLHLWHRTPNPKLDQLINPSVVEVALTLANDVIDAYRTAMLPRAQD
jgi:hypothetical protein